MTKQSFKALCIDGGGVRGIYPATILNEIEKRLGTPVIEHFDLAAGTSTGAIIAANAAVQNPMDEATELFEKHAESIFQKPPWRCGIAKSRYGKRKLRKLLQEQFGDTKLKEIKPPCCLMIPAFNISTGTVHVFKSAYLAQFEPYRRDGEVPLVQAVLASCSAPTYFDPEQIKQPGRAEPDLICDGGLWANDPSIFALTEAVAKFERAPEEVKILSIGTGDQKTLYAQAPRAPSINSRKRLWGLMAGWGGTKLIDTILNAQSQASSNQAELILKGRYPKGRHLRINSEIPEKFGLDKPEYLSMMQAKAEEALETRWTEIENFLTE